MVEEDGGGGGVLSGTLRGVVFVASLLGNLEFFGNRPFSSSSHVESLRIKSFVFTHLLKKLNSFSSF